MFLAEVLDPDAVQYRLNKVFDVLTTKDHHLYRDSELTMAQLVDSLEAESPYCSVPRRSSCTTARAMTKRAIPTSGRWWRATRVAAAVYGVPMVFMGQPLGIGDKLPFRESWADMYQAWTAPDAERER